LILRTNGLKISGDMASISGEMNVDSFLTIPQAVGKLAIDKPRGAYISIE
jgi:hypothetical protein